MMRNLAWSRRLPGLLCCWLLLAWAAPAPGAAVEYHTFSQPEQEQAYRTLTGELRCLVCQNQAIADSNADLARDLRQQVYEMLLQGKSRDEIVTYMTDRYGDFVLYRPAFTMRTWLLWLGPVGFLLAGLAAVWLLVRRKRRAEPPVLDAARQTRLRALLEPEDEQ